MKSPVYYIIKKEFKYLLNDTKSLCMFFVLPVVCILIFDDIVSTEINTVRVATVIEKVTPSAISYITPLTNNPNIEYIGQLQSVAEAQKEMRRGELQAVVVIASDFDQQASNLAAGRKVDHPCVQILSDASNVIIGNAANQYITSILAGKTGEGNSPFRVRMLYNPQLQSRYQFCFGVLALAIVFMCVILTSSCIVREKESHSIDLIIMSPVRSWQLLVGKLITYFITGVMAVVIALSFGCSFGIIPYSDSLPAFSLITLIYVVTSLLLGMLISLCSSTTADASSMSIMVVAMPVMYFSGMLFPVDSLPEWARFISNFIYVRWFIDASRELMIKGLDWTASIKECTYMLCSTVIFFTLCLYRLKNDRWLH